MIFLVLTPITISVKWKLCRKCTRFVDLHVEGISENEIDLFEEAELKKRNEKKLEIELNHQEGFETLKILKTFV